MLASRSAVGIWLVDVDSAFGERILPIDRGCT
jgi:hypothetical protein